VRGQGIKTAKQYAEWARSDKRPADIPAAPAEYYQGEGWTNWHDFLGWGPYRGDALRSYDESRDAVRAKGFKSLAGFREWARSGQKPDDIPAAPDAFYRGKGWTSWPDFLGTDNVRGRSRNYTDSRAFMCPIGLKTRKEFEAWAKSDNRPADIPVAPEVVYAGKGWAGWGDFLGTNKPRRGFVRLYDEARAFVNPLGLKSVQEHQAWAKSSNRPPDIPSHPDRAYAGQGWTSWGDYLGTGNYRGNDLRAYDDARAFVIPMGFTGQQQYFAWAS
jgi:hypothetical protein